MPACENPKRKIFPSLLNWVLDVLACFACLRAWVLKCLACLHAWRAYVLPRLACSRACVRVYVLVMMKCFIFLRVCVLCVLFFSYLLYISILKFKNSYNKKLVCFVNWTYLVTFWYKLIKLFELNLRVAVK